jgi:hypothetical protein
MRSFFQKLHAHNADENGISGKQRFWSESSVRRSHPSRSNGIFVFQRLSFSVFRIASVCALQQQLKANEMVLGILSFNKDGNWEVRN